MERKFLSIENRFDTRTIAPTKLQWLILSLLFFFGPTTLIASDDIASDLNLKKTGLTIVWFTEAGAGAGFEIVDWTLNVDGKRATTFFVVEAGTYREVISEKSLNVFGEPYGLDGGVAYMEVRKEIIEAELKNDGRADIEIKTDQYSLPKSTIFILSSNGVLTAVDADSGHQDWTSQFGSAGLPSIGVGASHEYVAAVNGSTVYCFEATTGKILWSHPCRFGVAAAPAVSSDRIYVPLLNGRMEVFEIKNKGYASYSLVADGIGTAKPLVTDKTVSWPTNKGGLNFATSSGLRQNSVAFRLLANDSIENSSTDKDGFVFATSLDGFVYAIDEFEGTLAWEVSTGGQITQSPVPIGDSVYAITDDHRMYRLDAQTGEFRWPQPLKQVGRFIGASRDRIYATDGFGGLLVIDPVSAAVLSRVPIGDVRFVLPNRKSDRLYIASGTGIVQCIHETGSSIPYFHEDELADESKQNAAEVEADEDPFKKTESEPTAPIDEPSTPPQEDDDDPFKT